MGAAKEKPWLEFTGCFPAGPSGLDVSARLAYIIATI
jgi:hypothetical protein